MFFILMHIILLFRVPLSASGIPYSLDYQDFMMPSPEKRSASAPYSFLPNATVMQAEFERPASVANSESTSEPATEVSDISSAHAYSPEDDDQEESHHDSSEETFGSATFDIVKSTSSLPHPEALTQL